MSSNEYKRATGYYTLQSEPLLDRIPRVTHKLLVVGVSGLVPVDKGLHVEVEVKDTIQRTQVIPDGSISWNETLPM